MPTISDRAGGEFLVNTATLSTQWQPDVTSLANGGFAIVWTDFSANATFLYDSTTGFLSYDADGSGAGAAVTFALLNPGAHLANERLQLRIDRAAQMCCATDKDRTAPPRMNLLSSAGAQKGKARCRTSA